MPLWVDYFFYDFGETIVVKMYLISDNVDTYTGMRLAGVEGQVVHERP